MFADTIHFASNCQIEAFDNGKHVVIKPQSTEVTSNIYSWTGQLPGAINHVIAVRARASKQVDHDTAHSAFLASIERSSNGGVTDRSWRCTNSLSDSDMINNHWAAPSYNDEQWPHALELSANGQLFRRRPDVRKNSQWIWSVDKHAVEVFCRSRTISSVGELSISGCS